MNNYKNYQNLGEYDNITPDTCERCDSGKIADYEIGNEEYVCEDCYQEAVSIAEYEFERQKEESVI